MLWPQAGPPEKVKLSVMLTRLTLRASSSNPNPPLPKTCPLALFIICKWLLMLYEQKQTNHHHHHHHQTVIIDPALGVWKRLTIVHGIPCTSWTKEKTNTCTPQKKKEKKKKEKSLKLQPLIKRCVWGVGWGGGIHQTSSTEDKACGEHKPKLNTTRKMGKRSCYQHRKIIMSIFIPTMCM